VDTLSPEEATPERLGLLMGGAHPEDEDPNELVGAVHGTGAEPADD
jgi:hypothetical protein